MDTKEPTLVIARHEEDVSWAKDYPHVVIQKGVDMPNIGRESASFLFFILGDYERLEGDYVFLQGNPFDHAPNALRGDFGEVIVSKGNGSPHHLGLDLYYVCEQLGLPHKDEYEFCAGGQFHASADQIKKYPWEWYAKALYLSTQGENPWVFERLWHTIYG